LVNQFPSPVLCTKNLRVSKALPQKSGVVLGRGQYRNAVASGQSRTYDILVIIEVPTDDPTLPRYGTDLVQR
jgi:hypothetical protein